MSISPLVMVNPSILMEALEESRGVAALCSTITGDGLDGSCINKVLKSLSKVLIDIWMR